jgi:hypothetical protein
MNDKLLLIVGALALFYLSSKKKGTAAAQGSKGGATVQTNPASRNTNKGIGNSPNSLNTEISDAASAVTNGIGAVSGAIKSIAGLGTGTTPGATVGVAATSPSSGTGNESFDAQDAIEEMSGSDHGEYSDNFLDDPALA